MEKIAAKLVDHILDTLESVKEALSLLPQLPPDLKPVYFRILEAIHKIGDDAGSARVSDISRISGFLLPNTTKFINEMVELNILQKLTSAADKRVVLVRPTERGEYYIAKYVRRFVEGLETEFAKIDEASCLSMIDTLQQVCQAMKKVYNGKEAEQP